MSNTALEIRHAPRADPRAVPADMLMALRAIDAETKAIMDDGGTFRMLAKQIYKVLKLMRLALGNKNAGETRAALCLGQKIIASWTQP